MHYFELLILSCSIYSIQLANASSSANANGKCGGLPSTTIRVKSLHYRNGRQANTTDTHHTGTVIYAQCELGTDFPNVKETKCGENGKWSVDRLDCFPCRTFRDEQTISLPLLDTISPLSKQEVICRAQIVTPYLIMTAASCFNKSSTSDYFLYLNGRQEKKFVKIGKIHYFTNTGEDNANHLALAEVKDRFTFSNNLGFTCLNENEGIANKAENYSNGASLVRCGESTHPSKVQLNGNRNCVEMDDVKPFVKKGMAVYAAVNGRHRVISIATSTADKLNDRISFADVAKYSNWIKSIVNSTNRDHNSTNTLITPISDNTPFQCSTGENITQILVCDGTKNCADGSDEMMKACRSKYPTYCMMSQLVHKFSITSCNDKIETSEGDLFSEFTLVFSPSEANVSRGNLQFVCTKGKWISLYDDEKRISKKCESLPKSSGVKALYYQNGNRVDVNNAHHKGTVIYPVCDSENGNTYPNVKEATCGEDGKWSVDSLECIHCGKGVFNSQPLIEITSSRRTMICWVHFVSPYLIMTAGSCFNESPTTDYYVDLGHGVSNYSHYANKLVSMDRSELIKVEQIYYFANSREENSNHPALAKIKDRLTLNTHQKPDCLDWSEIRGKALAIGQDYLVSPVKTEKSKGLTATEGIPKACHDFSNFPTNRSSKNEICVQYDEVDGMKEIKKGAGFYNEEFNSNNIEYLRGMVKDITSTLQPQYTIMVTDLWKYLSWIKSTIAATNLDHTNINTPIPQAPEILQQNGVSSFKDFEWSCYNGNTNVKFVNGCDLPEDQYLDFQIDTSSTNYKAYGEIAPKTKFGVPEHSVLRNIKCKDEYTLNFTNTQSSVCFQSTWFPQIPQC